MESFTNCSNKVDEELRKCMETIAYSNEETVLHTNHRGKNETHFSFGLYQAWAIVRIQDNIKAKSKPHEYKSGQTLYTNRK